MEISPGKSSEKPKIFMVGLGGTIAAKEIDNKWHYGHFTQKELLNLDQNIKKNFDVSMSNLFRLDSADTQPEHWLSLANLVYSKLSAGFDGIVVTHGTDTMHYSSSVLSFLIQDLNIPIVFTGSQILPTQFGSDASRNLFDSLIVASFADLAEVVIVFNGKVFRANRAKKVMAADFDAYLGSPNPQIGFVQHGVVLSGEQKKKGNRKPKLYSKLETNVALFEIHPGFNPKIMESAVENGAKGIVLGGYGVGNYPVKKNSLTPVINSIVDSGIPVVLTSQCRMGSDWKKVFFKEIGDRYDDAELIFGYDMVSHTALVKLMWVLGETNSMPKIKKMMLTNYAGEITPGLNKSKQVVGRE